VTRLTDTFTTSTPVLAAFVTAGDGPTSAILDALIEGGADIIELGMPFTDPMADGPAIQLGNIRSLEAGTTTASIFAIATDFRERHPSVPLVFMGYALATPTSDAVRLPTILKGTSGFLYYVSVAGITGKQQAAQDSIDAAVARIKTATDVPVIVGFGVRTPEQAAAIGRVADGVAVGTAIVELVGQHGAHAAGPVRDYVSTLKAALKECRA
jgi:tryptophan synthase alpha chain